MEPPNCLADDVIADREPSLYAAIDAADSIHSKSTKSWLLMMEARLLKLKRVLKPTGSPNSTIPKPDFSVNHKHNHQ